MLEFLNKYFGCFVKRFPFCTISPSVKLYAFFKMQLPNFGKTTTNLLKLIIVLYICSFLLFPFFIRFSMNIRDSASRNSVKNFSRPKQPRRKRTKFLRFDPFWDLVGTSGLEPPTSRLSGARSNHLSYAPLWLFSASRSLAVFSSTFLLSSVKSEE